MLGELSKEQGVHRGREQTSKRCSRLKPGDASIERSGGEGRFRKGYREGVASEIRGKPGSESPKPSDD